MWKKNGCLVNRFYILFYLIFKGMIFYEFLHYNKKLNFDYDGKIVLSEKLSIKCRIILRNCLVKDFSKRWNI